jgi:fibronectin-binding autotransporter adhesin
MNNVATTYSGGGIAITNGSKASIANSLISGNRATSTPGPTLGGGIILESAELTINRSEISRNSTPDGGGGIAVYGSTGVLTLDSSSRIINNTTGTTTGGGGILLTNGGKVNLNGATLDGNTPDNVRTN